MLIFTCFKCGEEFEPTVAHVFAMICPKCYEDFRSHRGEIQAKRVRIEERLTRLTLNQEITGSNPVADTCCSLIYN